MKRITVTAIVGLVLVLALISKCVPSSGPTIYWDQKVEVIRLYGSGEEHMECSAKPGDTKATCINKLTGEKITLAMSEARQQWVKEQAEKAQR